MDSTFLSNLRNNLKPSSTTCPKLEERLTDHRRLHHPKLLPSDRRGRYQVRENWRAGSTLNVCDDAGNPGCSVAPSSRPSKLDSKSSHGRTKIWEKLKALESSVEVKTRLVRRGEVCQEDDKCSKKEYGFSKNVDVDSKHVLHGTATFIEIGRHDAVSQSKEQQPYGINLEYKGNPKITNTKTENNLKDGNKSLENSNRSRILDDFIGNISLNSMTHNAKPRSTLNEEYDIHDAQEREVTNNMQELAENTIHCNKNVTKYSAEDILSPNLSKDNCPCTNKDGYIDELKNKSDIWKSYTKKIENEILKWFYLVPINPSEKRSRKYQRNKLIRNLIENVIELSNNVDDKDFKENVKFVIYICLDSLPIWHPGYEKEISELKQQLANVLLNKILDLSKMLRHNNSKYMSTPSLKENFHEYAINHHYHTHKVFKEDVKKQIIAEMIATLEETQRKVHDDVNKYLTNSLIANLGACINEKISASNIHKIRLFLIERLYTILYDLPVVFCRPKNETIDLYQLAEDVADSFLGIENTQNKLNSANFFTDVKSIQTVPIFRKTVESLAYLPSPKPSGNILIYQTKSGNLSIKSIKSNQARTASLPSLIITHNKAKKSAEEATTHSTALKINGENPLESTVTPLKGSVIGNRYIENLKKLGKNDTAKMKLDVEKLEQPASLTSLNISIRDSGNNENAVRSQHITSFHSLTITQSPAVDCKRSHASCQHVKWSEGESSNETKSCPEEKAVERYLVSVVNEYLKQYEIAEPLAKEAMVTRLLLEFQKINLKTRKDVYDKLKKGEALPTPISVEQFHNELVTLKAVFKWFGSLQLSKTILQHPQKQIFYHNFANQIHLLRTQNDVNTSCFENKLLLNVESFFETVGAKVCKTNIQYMKNALINRLIEEIHSEEARKNRPLCCKGNDVYKDIASSCSLLGTEEDLAKKFTDLVIDTNYNIDVCDEITREATIVKLVIEIRKLTGSKLTKNDVYNTLKKIHQPTVFDLDWFKRDLIYTSNIVQWLCTLPTAPLTNVAEKKRRSELIYDLANFFNNLQQKMNKGEVCNFLPDVTNYVAKWLDQVVMQGYAPSYEVFIYQLLKIMNIRKQNSPDEHSTVGQGSSRRHHSFEHTTYDKFSDQVPLSSSLMASPTARSLDEHSTLRQGSSRKHHSFEHTTYDKFSDQVPLSSSLMASPTACGRNRFVIPGQSSAAKHNYSFHKIPTKTVSIFEPSDIPEQSIHNSIPSSFRPSQSLADYMENRRERQTLHTLRDLPCFRRKDKSTSKRTIEDLVRDRKGKTRKCGCPKMGRGMLRDMPCVLMSPMLWYFPNL